MPVLTRQPLASFHARAGERRLDELPPELLLLVFALVDENESLRAVMLTCRAFNDVLSGSGSFWRARTVSPPGTVAAIWNEMDRVHAATQGDLPLPVRVEFMGGVDTGIIGNADKRFYATKCMRSILPPCRTCKRIVNVHTFWPFGYCYACLRNEHNTVTQMDANDADMPWRMRRAFFLPDAVEVVEGLLGQVSAGVFARAAIEKYRTFVELYATASRRWRTWRALERAMHRRHMPLADALPIAVRTAEQQWDRIYDSVGAAVDRQLYLRYHTVYMALEIQTEGALACEVDRQCAELRGTVPDHALRGAMDSLGRFVRRRFAEQLAADALLLHFLGQYPQRMLQVLADFVGAGDTVTVVELDLRFEQSFDGRVVFVDVFGGNSFMYIRQHDVGNKKWFLVSSEGLACRADDAVAAQRLRRSDAVYLGFARRNIVLPSHGLDPRLRAWIDGRDESVDYERLLDEQTERWRRWISLITLELRPYDGEPQRLSSIVARVGVLGVQPSEDEMHALIDTHFTRSFRDGVEYVALPLSANKVVLPMDLVDNADDLVYEDSQSDGGWDQGD